MYGFDSRTGQYFDEKRRFVSRATVEADVIANGNQSASRLKALVRMASSGLIDAETLEKRMQLELKRSVLQYASAGAGGADRLTASDYGKAGNSLRNMYGRLNNFVSDLSEGKLTLAQALARAEQYSWKAQESFYFSRQWADRSAGKNQARRWLGFSTKHCSECLSYSTGGQWRLFDEVVPNCVNCSCGGRCKCNYQVRVIDLSSGFDAIA